MELFLYYKMHPAVFAIATGVGRHLPVLAVVFGFTVCLRRHDEVKIVYLPAFNIAQGDVKCSKRRRREGKGMLVDSETEKLNRSSYSHNSPSHTRLMVIVFRAAATPAGCPIPSSLPSQV